VPASEWR